MRTRRFLLQPTTRQRAALERLLDGQRELYNAALEERRGAWRWERRSVSRYEQFKELTGWDHPVLEFGVVPARGTLARLDRAFSAFYGRCRRGERPGFPRFKAKARFGSVDYGDRGCWAYRPGSSRVSFMGVGAVKFSRHRRPMPGRPKTCVLRREGRRFVAYVVFEVDQPEPRAATGRVVGIDLGLEELVATSDGELMTNPRHLRHSAGRLAAAQRLVAGRKRGSNRRRRAGARVAAIHHKIADQRRDLHHHLSRGLVDHYDLIVHEDLAIPNMVRRPAPRPNVEGGYDPNGASAKAGLNREILAAGWGQLLRLLSYKAEEAGREIIAVDPRHTSRTCPACRHVDGGNRRGAVFLCLRCGHQAHADVNAAQNILRAGLARRLEREAGNVAA
jgi:putative transposase